MSLLFTDFNNNSFLVKRAAEFAVAHIALEVDRKRMSAGCCGRSEVSSVTRLGEKSPFGRFFKGLGDFFFQKRSPKFWLHFGRFFEMVQNLDF